MCKRVYPVLWLHVIVLVMCLRLCSLHNRQAKLAFLQLLSRGLHSSMGLELVAWLATH